MHGVLILVLDGAKIVLVLAKSKMIAKFFKLLIFFSLLTHPTLPFNSLFFIGFFGVTSLVGWYEEIEAGRKSQLFVLYWLFFLNLSFRYIRYQWLSNINLLHYLDYTILFQLYNFYVLPFLFFKMMTSPPLLRKSGWDVNPRSN